ncbi:hypothetical protein MF265_21465 [Serratia marcescens]|uniref:RHS repeat protein n=1 Tax=Serratia marcescens TaxID=615 RepID=UPI001EEFB81A|nr:RHS repeat protein [Serratia marcescens]ULH10472.1 hypothetical protein MF265_21465 [Serratia marcescens]
MSNANDFFTQAGNFTSAIHGQVDPRTGIYSINIGLGEVVGNALLGPSIPLTLSYSPMNTADIGLGEGVSFNLSSYNQATDSHRLTLSSGESYMLSEGNGYIDVQQRMLRNFDISHNSDDDSYRVVYKSGKVEILGGPGTLKVPQKIFTATGHAITLSWDEKIRLTGVTDDNQTTLFTVGYKDDGEYIVTLDVLPDSPSENYTVTLHYDYANGVRYLTRVNNTALDNAVWTIGYDDMRSWGRWATSLVHPGGMKEEATYPYVSDGQSGRRFPTGGPTAPLPYAGTFTLHPRGGQPPVVTKYAYSEKNFLGYDSGISWSAQQDGLYDCILSDYNYTTTTTSTSDTHAITVEYSYNTYHLLTSQKTTVQDLTSGKSTETRVETEYYAEPGKSAAEQLPYAQCPRYATTTWTDNATGQSRVEVTYTEYDEEANPTLKISNYDRSLETNGQPETDRQKGPKTEWEYYPESKDPNHFVRFIQTKTTTPAQIKGDEPVLVSGYQYDALTTPAAIQDTFGDTVVLVSEERQTHNGTLQACISYEYNTTELANFARLKTQGHAHYPDGEDGKNYLTTAAFTWNTVDGSLQKDTTTTPWDNALSTTHSLTQRCGTGRYTESVNPEGVKEQVQYYPFGGIKKLIRAAGTIHERNLNLAYAIPVVDDTLTNSIIPLTVTSTDDFSNQTGICTDGHKRIVTVTRTLNKQRPGVLHSRQYDALGRLSSQTNQDFHASATAVTPAGSVTGDSVYDAWNSHHRLSWQFHSTLTEHKETDPVKMTVTEYRSAPDNSMQSSRTITTYDVYRHPVQVDIYPAGTNTPASTTYQTYDGLGQLRSQTDELGRITTYEYDNFGRVTTTTLPRLDGSTTLAGSCVIRAYDSQSPAAWLSSISVQDEEIKKGVRPDVVIMGTQTFDSLGRITERASGGRTWTPEYASTQDELLSTGSLTKPKKITLPTGTEIHGTYSAALGGSPLSITSGSGDVTESVFRYHKSGALEFAGLNTETSELYRIFNMLDDTGRLEAEAFDKSYLSFRAAFYTWSTAGQMDRYEDVSGKGQVITPDDWGRPQTVEDDDVLASLAYDALGRLNSQSAKDKHSPTQATLTTTLDWDAVGREHTRTWKSSSPGIEDAVLTSTWYDNHQLAGKTLTRGGKTVRTESYTYDARNRLVEYTASGNAAELPQDEKGNRIIYQEYQYDVYSNITQLDSTFDDGSTDTMTCSYTNPDDPCQLTEVSHTHGSYSAHPTATLIYNASGHLTHDGSGKQFVYYRGVQEGYLKEVQDEKGATLTRYGYDAYNRLVWQDDAFLYYRGTTLVNQINHMGKNGESNVRLLTGPHGNLAQVKDGSVLLSGTDANGSVLSTENDGKQQSVAYGPYGEQILGD